jgi:hypothetical protein
MADEELDDQYSKAMQSFCWECQKIDFSKLSTFTADDVTEDLLGRPLGFMPADPNATAQTVLESECWLCNQRYEYFRGSTPACWIYVADFKSSITYQLQYKQINSKSDLESTPILCLHFREDVAPSKPLSRFLGFAWIGQRETKMDLITIHPLSTVLDISFVQECISLCQKQHGTSCCLPTENIKNMKLLDCRALKIVHGKGCVPYIALSYVWGNQGKASAFKYNGTSLRLNSLPKTIQDSITFTRRLGYQYLWIDQICIDQGNDIEFQQQIMQMDKIYTQADLTIIAEAGDDANFGLPGINSSRDNGQSTIDFGTLQLFPIPLSYKSQYEESKKSKWTQRGWTLQEGFLSRRKIFFTKTQVTYECRECTIPESIRVRSAQFQCSNANETGVLLSAKKTMLMNESHTRRNDKHLMLNQYLELITSFTSRNLSHDSDSFSAFAGIASYFNNLNPPIPHLHGIPISIPDDTTTPNLLKAANSGLLWYHDRLGWQPHNLRLQNAPYRRALFPSWTWVGWCGKIRTFNMLRESWEIDDLLTLRSIEFRCGSVLTLEFMTQNFILENLDTSQSSVLNVDGMLLRPDALPFEVSHNTFTTQGHVYQVQFRLSEELADVTAAKHCLSGELHCLAVLIKRSTYTIYPTIYIHFVVVQKLGESYSRAGTMSLEFGGSLCSDRVNGLKKARNWLTERSKKVSVKLI